MRFLRHFEWWIVALALVAAIGSIGFSILGAAPGIEDPSLRRFDAQVSAASALDRESSRQEIAPVERVRFGDSAPCEVRCRYADGTPVSRGVIVHEGVPIGEVVGSGLARLRSSPRSGSDIMVELEPSLRIPARFEDGVVVATCGFFVAARCSSSDPRPTRYSIERGRIDPRDRADFEMERAAGGIATDLEDLFNFTSVGNGEFVGDRLDPCFVEREHAEDRFAIAFARGNSATTIVLPVTIELGSVVDLGELELSPYGALTVAIENAEGLALEASFSRVAPEGRAAPADRMLARFDPTAFDALRGGAWLPISREDPRVSFAPLDAGEIEVVVRRADGPRLEPVRTTIAPGFDRVLVLDASPLRDVPCLRFTLLFAPDEAPIAGARLTLSDPTGSRAVSASTDEHGVAFIIDPERAGLVDSSIVIVDAFDDSAPERRFLASIPDAGPDGAFVVSIPRRKELRAVGLAPPRGAPRDAPLAYSVEIARAGEPFVPLSVEDFRTDSDGVTAFVTEWDAVFRIVAHYSAVYSHASSPVSIAEADTRVETTFGPPEIAPNYVRGRVVESAGDGLANLRVEVTSGGCLPPEIVFTDEEGRFVIGPVLADALEIRANGSAQWLRAPFAEDVRFEPR